MKLILASASPRRLQLLQQSGFDPQVLSVDLLEQRSASETPRQYCERIAREKALAGKDKFLNDMPATELGEVLILSADTEVVLDGEVFGKPTDDADAAAMLRRLSERRHEVVTAMCAVLINGAGNAAETHAVETHIESELQISSVTFKKLTDADVQNYIATGECFGKAGAYAIQGLGGCMIEYLQGSYTGVMGLPVFESTRLLNRLGCFANWQKV